MKGRTYVLNTKNIKEKDFELVGSEAIDNAVLMKEGVMTPPSFVITSVSFDDFLTAAGIAAPIMKILSNVRPFVNWAAKEASEQITNLILSAKFPGIMSDPISHAYQNLVDNNIQPLVSILPSHIIDSKFIPNAKLGTEELIIKGINDLFYYIKLAWLSLFTTEAIELRANSYYNGALSLGLIIKKKIRPEVSGKAYSIEPTQQDKNKMEINAIYGEEEGGINESRLLANNSDTYQLDRQTLEITLKNIRPQEFMFIPKIKVEKNEQPRTQVEISPAWKSNQKLGDENIVKVANILKHTEKTFNTTIEATWGIEAGTIFIMEAKPQIIHSSKKKQDKEANEVPEKVEADENKAKTPSIKELTEEVQAIVEGEIPAPEPENKYEVEQPQEIIKEDLPAKDPGVSFPEIKMKRPENLTKISYLDEFELKTPVYIDISTMNSKVISAVEKFAGGFFDGTEMILNNNILPEEVAGNNARLGELIEKYSLDISVAAKTSLNKSMIYQFSTISEYELKLLGIKEGKYKYNYDERFIDYPESLAVEGIALKKAMNQYAIENISICFPGVRNLQNLEDLKKVVSYQGIKRSSKVKFFCDVTIPSFIFEIDRMEKREVDGIIVSYTKLLKLMTFRNDLRPVDHQTGFKSLELLKTLAEDREIEFFVKLDNYSNELVHKVASLNPDGIIFSAIPNKNTLETIKGYEHKSVTVHELKKSSRGRKVKSLF